MTNPSKLIPIFLAQLSFVALPLTSLAATVHSAACNYDVKQDKLRFVPEYTTTAISGWYTDAYATPVTTINNVIYYVYVQPNLKVRVGQIKAGVRTEYDLDTAYTVTNDGHNEFSIALDKDGYVHVVGGMHNKVLQYWRSNAPYNVTKFTRHFGEIDGTAFTYNFFRRDRNGELYMGARSQVLKNTYNAIGGRGASVYHYDRALKRWFALGAVPAYTNAYYKTLAWENSAQGGKNYQMYQPDFRFDKNNRMHFAVAMNNDNATNLINYAIYAYSNDFKTFQHANGKAISPLPLRVDPGSSQADVFAGYYNAKMGEHTKLLLDANNVPGAYYQIDGANWYRYYTPNGWSAPYKIANLYCANGRCMAISDQDNGVMTIIGTDGKWFRFTKFGQTPTVFTASAKLFRWDFDALATHVYRAVAWTSNSTSKNWTIYRVDVTNPTKCY